MKNTKYHYIIVILILVSTIAVTPIVFSYLVASITIQNNGKILTATKPSITHISEIRGVFIHEATFGVLRNWTLIAETLARYGINAVFVNDQGGGGWRSEARTAMDAFHAKGIEYHSCMSVLNEWVNSGTEAITPSGNIYNKYAHCPIKAHDKILNTIRGYLTTFPDVDGIMLDYIRYAETSDICYCPYCRAAFQEWLNESITDWSPFYPNGARWNEYAEWRTLPITQLVKDIHDIAKSIKPNLVISEAAWTLFSNSAIYWRKWLGQDTAAWIKEGYLDLIAPMMYTKTVYGQSGETLESFINTDVKYWLGEQTEGPASLVALLRNDYGATSLPPEEFKKQIEYVRQRGLDGWILWRYSGPGGYLSGSPDITNYLALLNMPTTFALTNINVEVAMNSATITWITTLPATSKVEYSTSPLFGASWATQSGFHYWNITYTQGIIIEDYANVTMHSIRLDNLIPGTRHYFRIQSKGSTGIITTKVLTFTTK
ncbi:MAG: family 10 glycosylhydrolase [Candidatus Bathyarchaeia archaeon]